ncbi:hypothetical protein NEOLEDRAFT_778700 [Neolentinus lepideus HHB14362 ss-1]|uniref:Uncharacterized protein n=1 Tax=Neolentinus lepideus HHB14362 ss-1 TaxID=1314782 RepID=A0A165UVV6_9AGAM|nr:hypothetical protein NEOLEDRAFT_778700 [Neolentinus lepideus HHB14362 ss-1]
MFLASGTQPLTSTPTAATLNMTVPPKWMRKPTKERELCYSDIEHDDVDDDRSSLSEMTETEMDEEEMQPSGDVPPDSGENRDCSSEELHSLKQQFTNHDNIDDTSMTETSTETRIDEDEDSDDPDYEYEHDGYRDDEYVDDEWEEDWRN